MGEDGAGMLDRIRSILRCYFFMFGESSAYSDPGEDPESWLDRPEGLTPGEADRLVSIMRAYGLLFGSGLAARGKRTLEETRKLARFVPSLVSRDRAALKRSAIVPANLGSVFVRQGLGYPLFGAFRPLEAPGGRGILLCHQSREAEGFGRLDAAVLDGETALRYRGIGLEIDSSAPWLRCVISPREAGAETAHAPKAFPARNTIYAFDRFSIILARAKVRVSLKGAAADPFEYRYAYYFFKDGSEGRKIIRYLKDLFNGLYCVPLREAEEVALEFTRRLL